MPEPFRTAQEVPEENPLESERSTAAWPPQPGEAERARARAAARLDQAAPADAVQPAAHVEPPALADAQLEELVRRTLADLAQHAAGPVVHSPPRLSASQVVQ